MYRRSDIREHLCEQQTMDFLDTNDIIIETKNFPIELF